MLIDRLQAKIRRLKARLRRQEPTAKEGLFGSSTPSAKIPLKANTPPGGSQRRGGAKPGHRGHGRRNIPSDQVTRQQSVPGPERCPFGTQRLRGILVVDRYNGYNQTPCSIQYCYAHLLREVQDLGKEFPEVSEVSQFVGSFAPLLAGAMKLRAQELPPARFREQALQLKVEIKALVHSPAQHPGIQKIQNIFRDQAARLYHWAQTPAIPADNNRAERELRPLVIARKISFGSQSEQGAQTREVLMSVLHTLRKRTHDVFAAFKCALDALAQDETRAPYKLLFDSS